MNSSADTAAAAGERFRWYRWAELEPDVLYAFLKLRSDIFVVEQNCVFPDMDGIDAHCEHLCSWSPAGNLQAYLRLVPPGVKADLPSIGRVVVHAAARGTGLGRRLMQEGIRACKARYPSQPMLLSGQQHLEPFYASLGFATISAPYLEDGIWHVDMKRPAILSR